MSTKHKRLLRKTLGFGHKKRLLLKVHRFLHTHRTSVAEVLFEQIIGLEIRTFGLR